jgi:putative peptidoglycan lipid II flippase
MAVGTLASRLTGFLRTTVFIYALGSVSLANAYNNPNTLPNTVYYLMLGGIFTSVVVPLLVRAARHDADGGEAYTQRMFSLGVVALGGITVIGLALSAPLVYLYAPSFHGAEHNLTVFWAYLFIPQIFFYGMSSLIGAVLNTRGSFAAPMWTPVINNVVVIVIGGIYVSAEGFGKTQYTISGDAKWMLGVGTTLGIVAQTAALVPSLRRVGFRWRPDFKFRRDEVSVIGRMSGWMFCYVLSQTVGNLVVQIIANGVSGPKGQHGYSAYSYGWTLFQLPYAIIGISVITALLPRMSEHADVRRYSLVRSDFSTGIRLSSVIVVPAAIYVAVLGPAIAEVLFSYGSDTPADAQYIGMVFGLFSLGLVPYMVTQLQLRVFYSFHDSRMAALVGLLTMTVGILGDVIVFNVVPKADVVAWLGIVYGLSNLVGAAAGWILLVRRVGSLDGWAVARALTRMHLATVPGLVFAVLVLVLAGRFLHNPSPSYGLFVSLVGGGGAIALYAVCARKLRVAEFGFLMRTIAGRFGSTGTRH